MSSLLLKGITWNRKSSAEGDHAACIEAGSTALRRLDVRVSPHPSLATVIAAVVRFKWALTRTDLRTLTHQPRMSDVRAIAVDRILSRLLVPAFLSRATLVPVLVATQFDLLRRHGNSPSCAQCLMNAGTMSLMMSSPGLARRLGATGLQLLEQTAFDYHGKALATYGIILQQLSEDDRMAWQHFMIASQAARAAGDLEFASYGHQHAIDAGLSAGEPLATVRGWARDALAVEGTEHVTEQHDLATEQDRLIRLPADRAGYLGTPPGTTR